MLSAALLQATPDLIFVIGRDGTYLDYYAKDFSELLVPPEQFLGKTIRDIMPPHLAYRIMDAIRRTRADSPPIVVEYDLLMPQRRFFQARIVYADRSRVVSTIREITAIRGAAEQRQELAGRLIAAHENERARLARALDDGVGQSIASIAVELAILEKQASGAVIAAAQALQQQAAKIARELRALSNDLHPESLRLLGLNRALKSHAKTVALHREVAVHVHSGKQAEPKDLATALAFFRIAQDSLFNAIGHGNARRIDISVEREHEVLTMTIADNGSGFDTSSAIHRVGLGLNLIEERARLVNGQAFFRSQPGRTVVEVVVPGA